MKDSTILAISAMVMITILEAINLVVRGIDSAVFGLVVAAISGLGGYQLAKYLGGGKHGRGAR